MTTPIQKTLEEEIDELLEDAYQLGKTDATINVDDHKVIMPKMKAKGHAVTREYAAGELDKIHDRGMGGARDYEARFWRVINALDEVRDQLRQGKEGES